MAKKEKTDGKIKNWVLCKRNFENYESSGILACYILYYSMKHCLPLLIFD